MKLWLQIDCQFSHNVFTVQRPSSSQVVFYLKCISCDTVQGVAKAGVFPKSFLPCNNVVWWCDRVSYHFIKCNLSVLNVTFTPKYGLDLFNTLVSVKRKYMIAGSTLT